MPRDLHIEFYHRPGRTLSRERRRALCDELHHIGAACFDRVPDYQCFRGPDALDLPATDPRRRRAARLQTVCASLCDHHGLTVRAAGPRPPTPAIIVANHVGYLDPLVIAAHLPCAPIAKREATRWPVLGRALDSLGLIWVDRGSAQSGAAALRTARRLLDAGVSVLVFPEGTTTHGDRVLPFRRGVFGLAARLGVPVVPCAVRVPDIGCCWVGDDPFVPHDLRFAARAAVTVELRFGPARRVEVPAHRAAEDGRRAVHALLDAQGSSVRASASMSASGRTTCHTPG